MIHCVVFDVDDTLYSYQAAHKYAYQAIKTYAEHQLSLPPEQFDALHREIMREHLAQVGSDCAATHNRLIRYQRLLERLHLPLTHAPVMEHLYWDTLLAHMDAAPELVETVRKIRELGLRVGIGTNMTADWQFEKLSRLGLLPLVDFVVSSEEVNVEKPNPALFTACAKKAGCQPEECVFVGDSLSHDVAGALKAGLRPVLYCPSAQPEGIPEGVPVIVTMKELIPLLHSINAQ